MKTIHYNIASAIFEKAPSYIRGLVVIKGLVNISHEPEVEDLLRKAEQSVLERFTPESLLEDTRITSWKEAFRLFGMNPNEFRPAHEALSRRSVQAKPLPFINTAVDLGNSASLRYLMPIGVHPLDEVNSNLELRLATGNESFTAFGSDKIEHPNVGEVILVEENEVFTRSWVWRQAQKSITLKESKTLVVNIDAFSHLEGQSKEDVLKIAENLAQQMQKYCKGESQIYILDKENTSVSFEI